MKLTRHYLKEYNFVLIKHPREFEDKDIVQHSIDVNNETEGISAVKELSDSRDLKSIDQLTVTGVINAVKMEKNRPESSLAILLPGSALFYGMARAYQTFAADKRKEVKIFTDITEALAWLGYNEEDVVVLKKFIDDKSQIPLDN